MAPVPGVSPLMPGSGVELSKAPRGPPVPPSLRGQCDKPVSGLCLKSPEFQDLREWSQGHPTAPLRAGRSGECPSLLLPSPARPWSSAGALQQESCSLTRTRTDGSQPGQRPLW